MTHTTNIDWKRLVSINDSISCAIASVNTGTTKGPEILKIYINLQYKHGEQMDKYSYNYKI